MKVLLLAAGLGTRLRPLTDFIPKCLVPIRQKPLLGIWLDLFENVSDLKILINTHYKHEQVTAFIASHPFRKHVELVQEKELLGTGGTLLANRKFFSGSESFLVAHADNLTFFDPLEFWEAHQKRPPGCIMTMMTFSTPSPSSCGIVELDDRGVVNAFFEKVSQPPSNLANGAIYIFEPEIFNILEGLKKPVIDLSTEIIPQLMNKIYTFHNSHCLRDIGTLDSLQQAQSEYTWVHSVEKG